MKCWKQPIKLVGIFLVSSQCICCNYLHLVVFGYSKTCDGVCVCEKCMANRKPQEDWNGPKSINALLAPPLSLHWAQQEHLPVVVRFFNLQSVAVVLAVLLPLSSSCVLSLHTAPHPNPRNRGRGGPKFRFSKKIHSRPTHIFKQGDSASAAYTSLHLLKVLIKIWHIFRVTMHACVSFLPEEICTYT